MRVILAQPRGFCAGVIREELVDDVVAGLRSSGPIELSVLPGITENVEFRLPVELLRTRLARTAAS